MLEQIDKQTYRLALSTKYAHLHSVFSRVAVGGVPTVWYGKNTKMGSTHPNKNEKNEYYPH